MTKKSPERKCIDRIRLHIKRNDQIDKSVAKKIANDCGVNLKTVKDLVLAIRKRMFLLQEGGSKKPREELLNLAVSQIKNKNP